MHPTIGHVHLKVSNLERSIEFYREVLGMDLTLRHGTHAAFLSYGGYHHHLGLNTWQSRGGRQPDPSMTGLFHLAILFPTQQDLAKATRRVLDAGVVLDGAADHGVSVAVYFRDPDGNGIELYSDRPAEAWPRHPDGELVMVTEPLDLHSLLRMAEKPADLASREG